MKCLWQVTGPGTCLQPCASLTTGHVSHCSCCWPNSWGFCIVSLLSSALIFLSAKSFRMWISWSCNYLFVCSYSAASLKWRQRTWPEATARIPGAPQSWSGLCQVVTKPANISGSRFPCSWTGMLKPLCLGRSKFLSLCLDHSPCKVPYRAQPAPRAACPRGCAEPHSCRASQCCGFAQLLAVLHSWRRGFEGVGRERGLVSGEVKVWEWVMGVGSVWACLSSTKAISLPSIKLSSACWHFSLISCQHCLADLRSTSHPPSGLGRLQGWHTCHLTMERDLSISRSETLATRHTVPVGGCQVQGLEHSWDAF